MAPSFRDLIDYLLSEIAICGDQGMSDFLFLSPLVSRWISSRDVYFSAIKDESFLLCSYNFSVLLFFILNFLNLQFHLSFDILS